MEYLVAFYEPDTKRIFTEFMNGPEEPNRGTLGQWTYQFNYRYSIPNDKQICIVAFSKLG